MDMAEIQNIRTSSSNPYTSVNSSCEVTNPALLDHYNTFVYSAQRASLSEAHTEFMTCISYILGADHHKKNRIRAIHQDYSPMGPNEKPSWVWWWQGT